MMMKLPALALVTLLALAAACSSTPETDPHAGMSHAPPADAEHEGVTGPHGDHEPKHGGLVLMNEDLHYEVVFSEAGRHEVWFTDAMRSELPASLASHVTLTVMRPGEPDEVLALAIDDHGEAWLARGRPVEGDDVTVKISYAVMGEPYEIEVPFVAAR
jgi:hypothetical protein